MSQQHQIQIHIHHILVSFMVSSKVSSGHIDFGDELDNNGPNAVNNASVTANENISN